MIGYSGNEKEGYNLTNYLKQKLHRRNTPKSKEHQIHIDHTAVC